MLWTKEIKRLKWLPHRSFTSLFVPEHRLKPAPSVKQSLLNILKYNFLNVVSLPVRIY